MDSAFLKVVNLVKKYSVYSNIFSSKVTSDGVHAVNGVSFHLRKGETLGLVGESGCGKSTVAYCILQLVRPTEGHVYLEGKDLVQLKGKALRFSRRQMQIVFQDPLSSLNPRWNVARIIQEPLLFFSDLDRKGRKRRALRLLEMVELPRWYATKYPHQLSGGERQRVAIARALVCEPQLVICDEPLSALDVSIQAQILNLLRNLQKELHTSLLFISHDLTAVRYISHRVAVMYLGKIVEIASTDDLFRLPVHPYTRRLLSAVPIPDPVVEKKRRQKCIWLKGEPPNPICLPSGCYFHPRCPYSKPICKVRMPVEQEVSKNHWVLCHFPQWGEGRLRKKG